MNSPCDTETIIHKHLDLAVKRVDASARSIEFIATHQRLDADSQVVLVDGIDLRRYRANPTVLLQHDHHNPVARTTSLVRRDLDDFPALVGKAVFPEGDEDADHALWKVKAGLLNAVSIGFRSLETGPPILPGQRSVTHIKTELIEVSLVTVGSCATCLITAKSARHQPSRGELIDVDEALLSEVLPRVVSEALAEDIGRELQSAIDRKRGRIVDDE